MRAAGRGMMMCVRATASGGGATLGGGGGGATGGGGNDGMAVFGCTGPYGLNDGSEKRGG